MALLIFLFLLVFCLLLTLARLGRLGWLPLQPSHSAVASRRNPVHRLLKPRGPDDCPAGTAPYGGGQFGQLAHSLDSIVGSPYPSLYKGALPSPHLKQRDRKSTRLN